MHAQSVISAGSVCRGRPERASGPDSVYLCRPESVIYQCLFLLYQVYVAEADGIPEYGSAASLGKRLVAVKFLLHDACEREK